MKKVILPPQKGLRGIANVRSDKNTVSVVFESGEQAMLDKSTVTLPYKIPTSGSWFVEVSADRNTLYGIRPVEGKVLLSFERFGGRPGEPPSHFARKKYKEEEDDILQATAILTIIKGPSAACEGMIVPYIFRYLNVTRGIGFAKTPEGIAGIAFGRNPQKPSPHAIELQKFMEFTGGADLEVSYSANILPALEPVLQEQGRKFWAMMSKGYIAELLMPETNGQKVKPKAKKK